jgi:Tfp pilus assembly PilM family ATPase
MMDNSTTQLGLMMVGEKLLFVEAAAGHPFHLLTADATHLQVPFDVQAFSDPNLTAYLSTSINQVLDRFAITSKSVSVCLDRHLVLLKRLKVDRDLKEPDLRQQIEWELEQLLVAPRDEYHANYERIRQDRDHYDHVVVAVVRKAIIECLQNIFRATPLRLKHVDVDILATLRGLTMLKIDPQGLCAFIEMESSTPSVILTKNQMYLSSGEVKRVTGDVTEENSEQIATLINDEILRQLDTLGDEVLLKSIEQIHIVNSTLPSGVVNGLQRLQRSALIQIVNPLERLEHTLSLEAEQLIRDNPSHILPLLGLFRA